MSVFENKTSIQKRISYHLTESRNWFDNSLLEMWKHKVKAIKLATTIKLRKGD